MAIDISDLESHPAFQNVRAWEVETWTELHFAYQAPNVYGVSRVVDIIDNTATLHLIKSAYKKDDLIDEFVHTTMGDCHRIPIYFHLPSSIRRIVIGSDFYMQSGEFFEKADGIYFGYHSEPEYSFRLTCKDENKLQEIVAEIPAVPTGPFYNEILKTGEIFSEFPKTFPKPKELFIKELRYRLEFIDSCGHEGSVEIAKVL